MLSSHLSICNFSQVGINVLNVTPWSSSVHRLKCSFCENQLGIVELVTCPAIRRENIDPNMAFHSNTLLSIHTHTHPLFTERVRADSHMRGWSFHISVWINPPLLQDMANIQSVMELQFTWAHTFQLIQPSALWRTCERCSAGGGGWLRAAEHEVTQQDTQRAMTSSALR